MSQRLHEIIAQIAILHKELIENNKIDNVNEVLSFIKNYEKDIKEHYLNLLLQYYFQKNDLENLKVLLLLGAKFDMRFEDVKEAFLNTKNEQQSVIEFLEDNVLFLKDTNIGIFLKEMYDFYQNNKLYQNKLEKSIELIKRNRYVCITCYKNLENEYAKFFLNEDLLQSLKKDLPYLLKN